MTEPRNAQNLPAILVYPWSSSKENRHQYRGTFRTTPRLQASPKTRNPWNSWCLPSSWYPAHALTNGWFLKMVMNQQSCRSCWLLEIVNQQSFQSCWLLEIVDQQSCRSCCLLKIVDQRSCWSVPEVVRCLGNVDLARGRVLEQERGGLRVDLLQRKCPNLENQNYNG